jgi:hypothetical protein
MGSSGSPCFTSEELVGRLNKKVNCSYAKSLEQYLLEPEQINLALC